MAAGRLFFIIIIVLFWIAFVRGVIFMNKQNWNYFIHYFLTAKSVQHFHYVHSNFAVDDEPDMDAQRPSIVEKEAIN